MSAQTITVRASAWGKLFDCAHKFEWENLMGRFGPSGLRAQLGTAVHAGTAAFDQSVLDGSSITPDDAAGEFVQALHNPDRDVDMSQDTLTLRDAERIGLALVTRYCTEVAPQFDYVDVETKLDRMEIDCGNGVTVALTGTMDRARAASTDYGVVIPDIKTGARIIANGAVQTRGRSAQLGTYQLMYEHTKRVHTAGAQIIGLSTGSRADVGVSSVFDAKRVMLGTDDEPGLLQHAAVMFASGHFPPNPSSPLCSKKYCARWAHCIFHE